MNTKSKREAVTPCEEKTMKTIFSKLITGTALLLALSAESFAQIHEPPPFTFKDRFPPPR